LRPGNMDVDVLLLVEVRLRAVELRPRAHVGEARRTPASRSPSCPVRTRLPLPRISVVSMCSTSPPDSVQASPVVRPISAFSPFLFSRNFALPRNPGRLSAVTVTGGSTSFPRMRRAIFRHTDAISRSRLRTPASRVYFSMRP
jgi:hypothetical protein